MKYINLILLIFLSNILVAQTKIDSLEALLPEKQGLEKVKLLNELAFEYWNVSPDKGLSYAKIANTLALKEKSKADIAKSLKNIGTNYWAKSELHLALENYQEALKIYKEINDPKGICSIYGNIGIVYKELSDYENALKHYLKSLEISDKEGFNDICIQTITNISNIYINQENYSKAQKYIQEAIDMSEKFGNTNMLANQINTLGQIYSAQNKLVEAKSCFEKSLEINRNDKNNFGSTIALYNIGGIEHKLKNYAKAIKYFQESLLLSTKINDQIGVLMVNKSIGLIYKEQNKFDSTLFFYKKSFDLAQKLDLKEEKLNMYNNYSELYKSIGKFNIALDYLEKYISLNDSIYNENSSKQIAEMQTKYDSEKKEKENELLRKNNEIQSLTIARQTTLRNSFIALSLLVLLLAMILYSRFKIKKDANEKLFQKNNLIEEQKEELILKNNKLTEQYDQVKLLNATKDKFFKIISHDLKAPFNSIIGFADLLKSHYSTLDDVERIEMIREIDKSSQFAYELLINLLTWARAQTGEIKMNKEPLILKELVETCANLYGQSAVAKNIDIVVNIPTGITLTMDRNTSLIFIGNLINNAIKFTPEGGLLSINTSEEENFVRLHIVDTGIGMPPEVIKNLFKIDESISTQGTNNEKGTGLGLILCKEFVEKNGGDISVISEVGKGSEFIITLSKN
jgi:signal transduction histidine kinase